ncbi:CvpA family protein [Candidatus Falkowbacteria bacterium]|nr:CvpA family protein [Candidatus Falkowbacteria bacterium]
MLVFDAILLVILAGFIFYGLFFGLIRTFGSLMAVVGGLLLSTWLYQPTYDWAAGWFSGHEVLGRVAIFFLLYGIINRMIALGFYLLDHAFDLISIIPFLKTINRVAGALFGLLEGALLIGLALYMITGQRIVGPWVTSSLANSKFAPYFIKFILFIKPVFPQALELLKSLLNI